ncbi:hypothetical protein MTO96_043424 [Rhipicephalus appendiculatus]
MVIAVHADDITLFASGPTTRDERVHSMFHCLRSAIDMFIRDKGMRFPEEKTEAMLVGRSSTARYVTPRLTQGMPIAWTLPVNYLGILFGNRLIWTPAVNALCKNAKGVHCDTRGLLAPGHECPPTFALCLFNGLASARIFYRLPLTSLSRADWDMVDAVHWGCNPALVPPTSHLSTRVNTRGRG